MGRLLSISGEPRRVRRPVPGESVPAAAAFDNQLRPKAAAWIENHSPMKLVV